LYEKGAPPMGVRNGKLTEKKTVAKCCKERINGGDDGAVEECKKGGETLNKRGISTYGGDSSLLVDRTEKKYYNEMGERGGGGGDFPKCEKV